MNELTEAWGDTVNRTEFLTDTPDWLTVSGGIATTLDDRKDGSFRPVYDCETDLAMQRAQARALCGYTRIGDGAVDAMASYIFGNGLGFEVTCKLEGQADDLVRELQRIVDEFCEAAQFAGDLDREIHKRTREDGEAFIRLKRDSRGRVKPQLLEPDQITEPGDPRRVEEWEDLCNHDDPPLSWKFGVATDSADTSDVVGYYVQTDSGGQDWEFLRTCHIEHLKRNVTRNAKRGVTDFYGIFSDLRNEATLRRNSATGAAVQAAIAWIVQHAPGVTSAQAASIGTGAAIGTVAQPAAGGGTRLRNALKNPPGTVLHVENGRQFLPGPMGAERNAGFVEIAQYTLRAIGQRWNAPEYLISGDASNANYSSSLVAESPFVKARQADQQWYGARFKSMLWKVIEMHWKAGRLDRFHASIERIRHWCDIVVNYPTVESRDPLKIAQTQKMLEEMGVISPKTIAAQHDLDLDEEIRQGAKKPAPAPMLPGFPGMDGQQPQQVHPAMLQQQEKLKAATSGDQEQPTENATKATATPLQSAVEAALESVRTSAEARAILEQLTGDSNE